MIKLEIDNLGMNFEGIARNDGKVYFVPNALVGETVEVQILEEKPKFANCKLINVLKNSQDRVEPFCPYFNICGGCNIQHLQYDKQLFYKTSHVKDTINKVAGLNVDVLNTIPSQTSYYYRNKAVFPISNGVVGMFKENSHDIINISQCFLANDNITKALKAIKDYVKENNLKGYDFKTFKGDVKFAVIRSINNQTLVCLVTTKDLPNLKNLYNNLEAEIGNVGLYLNYNNLKNSIILGKDYKHVAGIKEIGLIEFDINYTIDVASFLQVNNYIKTEIYKAVQQLIKDDVVIDAYAGAGLLSAMLAKTAKQVYSVEIVEQATKNCKKLIKQNNINNVIAINGDCSKIVPQIVNKHKNFSIVLDPAHNGCTKSVIDVCKKANKIVYISCNPIALAKDLKELTITHNIEFVQPYDMFPQTKHVETLVYLTKKAN